MIAIDERASLVLEALDNFHLLEFEYHGKRRVVRPFILGACNERVMLSAVQVEGDSPSGWKTFCLDEMSDIQLRDETFDPRKQPDYNPWDPLFNRVFAQVS